MPNSIKYNTSTEANALRVGDFHIGVGDVVKGPTDATGFYSGINPPSGSYTIYQNKASQGPSIICPANDADLITITSKIAGETYQTIDDCFTYFAGQSDKFVLFNPINHIITDDLELILNANQIISYPTVDDTWYDISGNSRDGTLTNGVVFDTNGYMDFDGVDDYVAITSYTFGNGDWTVSMLINADNITVSNLLSNTSGGPVTNAFGFGSSKIHYRNYDGAWQTHDGDTTLTTGTWHHLTWVNYGGESAADGTMKMYVDGVADSEVFNSYTTNGGPCNAIGSNWFNKYNGRIANCQFYDEYLTDAEVLQNYYQGSIITDSLVFAVDASSLVSFENGTTTTHSLTGSIDGTLTNGVAYSDYANGTWNFDGVDDYISCGNDESVNIAGPISVEAWVSLKSTPEEAGSVIVTKGNVNGGAATVQYNVHFNTNRAIVWQISDGSSTNSMTTDDTIDLGDWYHICCTHDADNTNSYVYINGELSKSDTSSIGNLGGTSINLTIGYDDYTDRYPYIGMISNVRIYSKTLSASEILQNYNANINQFN